MKWRFKVRRRRGVRCIVIRSLDRGLVNLKGFMVVLMAPWENDVRAIRE